ncbi:conserved hypothetical protein [Hyphomicrobiales bacterium]|nr:conserved hypothetical protein [Hyphomicrobiales bacterium]CAH1677034.1 conserved hypothetical protein [Hyphomicrobiales bacterium]
MMGTTDSVPTNEFCGVAQGRYADPALTELDHKALRWLDTFYQLEHMLAAREWAIRLSAGGSPELRFAAIVHDAERFFPGGPTGTPQNGFDDADYLFAHSTRSADIVDAWLDKRSTPVPAAFRKRVRALILRHELGGDPEEDILQAADSLSFLSTYDWLVVGWVRDGHYTIAGAREKLDWMLNRIRVPAALRFALPIYVDIVRALDRAHESDVDISARRKLAGNRAYLLGLP